MRPDATSVVDCFRNREIVFVTDEEFGVKFTHWISRRYSWSMRWKNVLAIDAMQVEPAYMELIFLCTENRWRLLAEDFENWSVLEAAVRRRYPDFNWENFERAKNSIDKRYPCWERQGV